MSPVSLRRLQAFSIARILGHSTDSLLPLSLRRSTSSSLMRLVVTPTLWKIRFTSATMSPLYETYASAMSFPRNSLLQDSLGEFWTRPAWRSWCELVASVMGPWTPLLFGILITSITWNFGHHSWLPQRVVFAIWDLCRFSWSPPLCRTFVASVGRETFVASVGRLRYVAPWPPPLL